MLSEMFSQESDEENAEIQKVLVSKREEDQFGDKMVEHAIAQWRQRGVEVTDRGADHEYLTVLVDRIHPLMKNAKRYKKIRVLLADTGAVDARSFPGGTIVVLRGMIDFCESEAALVGVLGHELSHIDRGHQLYQLRRWKKAQSSFQSASNLNEMMNSGMGMAKMFMRPFRPAEELEADSDGARWAFQLGYDPMQMAKVFQRLATRDRGKQNVMPDFLRSHPYHADRYLAVIKHSDLMHRKAGNPQLFVGQAELESRTARGVAESASHGR